ncbi:hypothetical protein [Nostoc sp. DSM 114160]
MKVQTPQLRGAIPAKRCTILINLRMLWTQSATVALNATVSASVSASPHLSGAIAIN